MDTDDDEGVGTDDDGWATKRRKTVEPDNDATDSDVGATSQRSSELPAIEVAY